MLKLLIVDDEPTFREGLIKTIDWDALDITIAGEAYNGIEALKIIDKTSIDLVITDIRMPEMDGLELIRKAIPTYPEIRFIVLSAFDDFNIVKSAFHLGIVDYLLKSEISEKELKEILNRQTLELTRRKNHSKWIGINYAEKDNNLIIRQVLRNCVNRKLSITETPELQEYFSYSEKHPFYSVVLCLHYTDYSLDKKQISQNLKSGISIINTTINAKNEWIGYFESNHVYLFHIPDQILNWLEFSKITDALRMELLQKLTQENPLWKLTAGFSSTKKSSILSRQKTEAEKACQFGFFRGINKSIGYNHYKESLTNKEPDLNTLFRDFVGSLTNWDIQGISDNIIKYQFRLSGNLRKEIN